MPERTACRNNLEHESRKPSQRPFAAPDSEMSNDYQILVLDLILLHDFEACLSMQLAAEDGRETEAVNGYHPNSIWLQERRRFIVEYHVTKCRYFEQERDFYAASRLN